MFVSYGTRHLSWRIWIIVKLINNLFQKSGYFLKEFRRVRECDLEISWSAKPDVVLDFVQCRRRKRKYPEYVECEKRETQKPDTELTFENY